MAVAVDEGKLYTIGRGTLRIFTLADPADPKALGSLGGLGNTRQLAVRDGVAYVTSREDGVFIVGVANPTSPALLCHYDSIEVATGVAVSGQVLFIACRLHGVELVNVADPRKPLHLSTVRTGEAQSVDVRNGYAYVGVWGTSELVVVDARNPRAPEITVRCPLDGFGDGVAVRGSRVFVATGHHSRERKTWYPKEGDPGYGQGHGLEVFDLSDPAKPAFVSRIKTPPFYRLGNDMWGVTVSGDHAFLADTHNGMFAVDVADPARPHFVAHRQLPVAERDKLPDFVGGLALADGYVYVAGGGTDLYVLAAPGLAKRVEREPDAAPAIPPFTPQHDNRFDIYRPDGQVRAVDLLDDLAVVAAGSDGLHVVQLRPEIALLHRYPTEGFAMQVRVAGDRVYVAEERGGLSIWRASPSGELALAGRYQPPGRLVRDVAVPAPSKYALLQLDLSRLDMVDVSNPAEPKSVFTDTGHGFLYDMTDELLEGRLTCVLWQLDGVHWYDLYGGPTPTLSGKYEHRLGSDGLAVLDGKPLTVYSGGFFFPAAGDRRPPSEQEIHHVPNCRLRGKPCLRGDRLYVSDRASGDLNLVDVSDVAHPKLLEHLNLPGNPGRVVLHDGKLVVPNGYEGLWVERRAGGAGRDSVPHAE
jgi:hypothetical protein